MENNNYPLNIRFVAKTSDIRNFSQNIRSHVKTSKVATLVVTSGRGVHPVLLNANYKCVVTIYDKSFICMNTDSDMTVCVVLCEAQTNLWCCPCSCIACCPHALAHSRCFQVKLCMMVVSSPASYFVGYRLFFSRPSFLFVLPKLSSACNGFVRLRNPTQVATRSRT